MTDSLARTVASLLERFSADVDEGLLAELGALYDPDVVFRDPLQTVRGREAFLEMNRRLAARARVCRFDVTTWATRGEHVFLAWTMTYAPRRAPEMVFEGTSLLELRDGRVVSHRDYWDLLGGVLGAVPGVGRLYRRLIARLG